MSFSDFFAMQQLSKREARQLKSSCLCHPGKEEVHVQRKEPVPVVLLEREIGETVKLILMMTFLMSSLVSFATSSMQYFRAQEHEQIICSGAPGRQFTEFDSGQADPLNPDSEILTT